MKLRELLTRNLSFIPAVITEETDFDVYNDVVESSYPRICTPLALTPAANRRFSDVLDCDITISCDTPSITVHIDDAHGYTEDVDLKPSWERKHRLLRELTEWASGMCTPDEWFAHFSRMREDPDAAYYIAACRLSDMLYAAKGMTARFCVMDEKLSEKLNEHGKYDMRGNKIVPNDKYIRATAANGYEYYINVTGDSVMTAMTEAVKFLECK